MALCLFYKYFYGNYSDELSSTVPRVYEFNHSTRLVSKYHHFTVEMAARCNREFYALTVPSSFCTFCLGTFHPAFCFLVNFDLEKFKCNVSCYLLSS